MCSDFLSYPEHFAVCRHSFFSLVAISFHLLSSLPPPASPVLDSMDNHQEAYTPNSIAIMRYSQEVIQSESTDEDGKTWTRDGSLDYNDRPAHRDSSGGWISGFLLLANQTLSTFAFVGVEVNLVLFCTRVLKQANAEASNTFSRWIGSVNLFSLFGAFLSDAYLGRYKSCTIFQTILTIGIVMLSFTTSSLLLKPDGCGKVNLQCGPHSQFELTMFYLSIYLMAFGNGASEPSIATFGTDQFDEENDQERDSKKFFYSYFYVATNIGSLFSETVLAYLENLGYWMFGFLISTASAVLALIVFCSGTYRYRHFRTCGNPAVRFCQVIVAAWKKSSVEIPAAEDALYEMRGEVNGMGQGGRRLHHTKEYRFLDHAAIITSKDSVIFTNQLNPSPWNLCTITQVEEVKCVFRLLPIWLCTITFTGLFVQMISLYVEQGASMKANINEFHIPPASMTVFDIIFSSTFIVFYKRLIKPLYTKIFKTVPKGPSELKKMGYGLICAMTSMVVAGFVEIQRKTYAKSDKDELSSLFILWQVPQYVILGVGEAFVYVSLNEFFGSQVPDVMRSLGIALSLSSNAVGSYFCSLILSVVMKVTTKNGRQGWIPPNLNDGFLEMYFFMMTIFGVVELGLYVLLAQRYKPILMEAREDCRWESGQRP